MTQLSGSLYKAGRDNNHGDFEVTSALCSSNMDIYLLGTGAESWPWQLHMSSVQHLLVSYEVT